MDPNEPMRQQVASMRDPRWLKRASKRLPRQLRGVCDLIADIVRVPDPKNRWTVQTEKSPDRIEQTFAYFGGKSEAERREIWGALFPKLAPHIESAWQRSAAVPYQTGWHRRPFRAPGMTKVAARAQAWFFVNLIDLLHGLDEDAPWLARWTPHLHGHFADTRVIGLVLASVLDAGGPDAAAVRGAFSDLIAGVDEVGFFDRHVVRAMLHSSHRSDWETIERLLLAAQRQEGLRQAILEEVDEASPRAFRHMLRVILDHDLTRFSSAVRAFDVWFGVPLGVENTKFINSTLRGICDFLDDDAARQRAIESGDGETLYTALWATAYEDAGAAMRIATSLLGDPDPERRYIAHHVVIMLRIPDETDRVILDRFGKGNEPEEGIRWLMIEHLLSLALGLIEPPVFESLARELDSTTGKVVTTKPIVWPWNVHRKDRAILSGLLVRLSEDQPERLIPYVDRLEPSSCAMLICGLAGVGQRYDTKLRKHVDRRPRTLTGDALRTVIALSKSPTHAIFHAAFQALRGYPVSPEEAEQHISQLHRAAPYFRAAAIVRLTELPDGPALECVGRLLTEKNARQRAAGLELAESLIRQERRVDRVRQIVEPFREHFESGELAEQFRRVVLGESPEAQIDEYLGLIPDGALSGPPTFRDLRTQLETAAARACITQVAELVLQYAETEVKVVRPAYMGGGAVHCLFSQAREHQQFPGDLGVDAAVLKHEADRLLPLASVWTQWLADRGAACRDPDGLELVRASILHGNTPLDPAVKLPAAYRAERSSAINETLRWTLTWLAILSAPANAGSLLVQNAADALAGGPISERERAWLDLQTQHKDDDDDDNLSDRTRVISNRLSRCSSYRSMRPSWFTRTDRATLAAIQLHAIRTVPDETTAPRIEDFAEAYDAGLVNEYDFIELLLIVFKITPRWVVGTKYLELLTTRKPHPALENRPALADALRRTRDRLIELELTRGEAPLPCSWAANRIRFSGGATVVVQLMTAMGKDHLVRGPYWSFVSRAEAFSHLIMTTMPNPGDTPEAFAQLIADAGVKKNRLLELAMFAPQWAGFAAHAVGINGLEEAVWWIHAHTKSREMWDGKEIREFWEARISERTEVPLSDLEDGAVDVEWFRRAFDTIGADGWNALRPHCKYASTSGSHKRAELFAAAIRGEVPEADLLQSINDKRHQDSVRALGLLPLDGNGPAAALARYQRLQEFKRESRKFGSMRQTSEGRAVEIGLQNLARTAGLRDTRRLEWSMETEAVADLTRGPVTATEQDTTVALSINDGGDPELTITKRDRLLKEIPAKLRKHQPFAALKSRVSELKKQRARMRLSLEESMCRGDEFSRRELMDLCAHPMLRPMLERLIFIGGQGLAGYPIEGGRALRDFSGAIEPIGASDTLRLAHPIDLLERGDWARWQRECFESERVQPFKQVFREVYPRTAAELAGSHSTTRYSGHQVQPRQASALFKQRGWLYSYEEGIRRVFHDHAIIAEVEFAELYFSPAEVENAEIHQISFRRRDLPYRAAPIDTLCPRLFSEAMRDLDLVVSVAHAGGVDPEASASTIEMRGALVRETCALLELHRVRVEGNFVRIDGEHNSYTVHLGSGNATVAPARALVIVAVHSQHRGRLFLPFADDDPRTAEVMSKTLLLARDREIKDPAILRQIRG